MGLSQQELRKRLSYDPETGEFIWLVGKKVGQRAGFIHHGYREICIDSQVYKAASWAWLYVHGELITRLDHKNRNKSDDRLENLRPATRSQNGANRDILSNNQTGVKGVYYEWERKRFKAQIKYNGRIKNLGRFNTREEAGAAYARAAEKLHGEFATY